MVAVGDDAEQDVHQSRTRSVFRFFGSFKDREKWKACEAREMLEQMQEMRKLWEEDKSQSMADMQRDLREVQKDLDNAALSLLNSVHEEKTTLSELIKNLAMSPSECGVEEEWDAMQKLVELWELEREKMLYLESNRDPNDSFPSGFEPIGKREWSGWLRWMERNRMKTDRVQILENSDQPEEGWVQTLETRERAHWESEKRKWEDREREKRAREGEEREQGEQETTEAREAREEQEHKNWEGVELFSSFDLQCHQIYELAVKLFILAIQGKKKKLYTDLTWVEQYSFNAWDEQYSELRDMRDRWMILAREMLPQRRTAVLRLETEKDHRVRKLHRIEAELELKQIAPEHELQATQHNWFALDALAQKWLRNYQTQNVLALNPQQLEDRAKQFRRQLGRETLFDIMLINQKLLAAQSPYLDSLLVFAGLFSGVLSAFLVDIRKGLQEDLLLEILHQLQNASQKPFQPTFVSVWANGLWFSSLSLSLTGALVVMLTKLFGKWSITEKEVRAIFTTPERLESRRKEIHRIHMHDTFQRELLMLISMASTLIFTAVILFIFGLGVLLYTTERNIGLGFLALTSTMVLLILGAALHIIYAIYGN